MSWEQQASQRILIYYTTQSKQLNTNNDKMIYFQTHEIESWINEDAPLLDLTGHLLEINNQSARLTVKSRHATRLSMMEEAARIFELLGRRD
ncbi:hypothetical protein [Thiomicrorhabdus sp. 6S3-12]|uniref:hypothetical protein n=1 Tax=Thiomicrorhabdus sp. 6S3-12 TaxID=2819681 RepID=UPI001AAD503F|nr:hypothetical protein [Thiomicrorhabdus sp. 6S3-12]MBO1924934.1 hypothetical protein [Thiomicrorhabdus sp. 6S3-12]